MKGYTEIDVLGIFFVFFHGSQEAEEVIIDLSLLLFLWLRIRHERNAKTKMKATPPVTPQAIIFESVVVPDVIVVLMELAVLRGEGTVEETGEFEVGGAVVAHTDDESKG